jgi:hypothetical protein
MPEEARTTVPGLALKIGVAGAIGFGALVTGMVLSRKGRNLFREALQGRQRTRIEDRVLDYLWGDPIIGRRRIDVKELEPGVVRLLGDVREERERRRALGLARRVPGVERVLDGLEIDSDLRPIRRVRRAPEVEAP